MSIELFNRLPGPEAQRGLADCCASPGWVHALLDARPYAALADILDTSDEVLGSLDASEIERAVAAHPRIGRPPTADGPAAAWSRREQSAVAGERAQLAAGCAAYERRFGRVFLISASGLGAGEVLAQLNRRLGNTEQDELLEVRRELGAIARIRLGRLLE